MRSFSGGRQSVLETATGGEGISPVWAVVLAWLVGRCLAGVTWRQWGVRERLEEASRKNRMQQTTVCLVFLDSCGCSPGPKNPSQGRASGMAEYGL